MTQLNKAVHRLLHPKAAIKLSLFPVAAALLILTFIREHKPAPLTYISYVLSAYALVILVLDIPPLVTHIKSLLRKNPHASHYLSDHQFRAVTSLYAGLCMNCLYAAFKLFTGLAYHSLWFGAMAIYYIILSLCRFLLVKSVRKSSHVPEADVSFRVRNLQSYRHCGFLMFILNTAATVMVVQMIWQNKGYHYPEMVVYVVAAYAFYSFILALINAIRYRKMEQPVLSAAKMLSLAQALMSMLALQTAMFAEFGGEAQFRRLMNSLTGFGVCLIVFSMAIYMIVRSGRLLKEPETNAVN